MKHMFIKFYPFRPIILSIIKLLHKKMMIGSNQIFFKIKPYITNIKNTFTSIKPIIPLKDVPMEQNKEYVGQKMSYDMLND